MDDIIERLRPLLSERYSIEREIGRGGMAHVLLARDRKHRRLVALKVLRPELALGVERFLREIEIASGLTHPNVLPVHDSGEADGLLYYVMPFIEGESLRDRLDREKQLSLEDALRITGDVADALAYAHGRGVLHRDIKPENILLVAGHAIVTDFGIARAVSAAAEERLTGTGITLGTVQYMSPEQAAGERTLDGRTDVYSLGCVLYEMLAGEAPFSAPTPQRILARRMSERAPTLEGIREGMPPALHHAIRKALATVPADRFPTAAHFAKAIAEAAASATVASSGSQQRTLDRQAFAPRVLAVVGIAVAVLVAGIWAIDRDVFAPTTPPPGADRVAVLPFVVHGSDQLAYLGEGIVDLLSRDLEGVDDLQCIDPGTIMSLLPRNAAVNAETGRALIRRVRAGAFILGSIHPIGARVRIQARLYNAGDTDAASPPGVQVEGDTATLLQLVDQLAADLLVQRRPRAAHRLTPTAALTTHSLPALKSFLNAEQLLRAGKPDSAITGYQRALAEDTSFALAYYRLAVAAGWSERHALSSDAVARGLALSDRLAERDRRLVTAYSAFRSGAVNDAERQYRSLLDDFPDDLEAQFQLGDLLFQYNPLRGRPRAEARPLLDQVLAHDPGFL